MRKTEITDWCDICGRNMTADSKYKLELSLKSNDAIKENMLLYDTCHYCVTEIKKLIAERKRVT